MWRVLQDTLAWLRIRYVTPSDGEGAGAKAIDRPGNVMAADRHSSTLGLSLTYCNLL